MRDFVKPSERVGLSYREVAFLINSSISQEEIRLQERVHEIRIRTHQIEILEKEIKDIEKNVRILEKKLVLTH